MALREDERGVSAVVGALHLFAVLIVLLSINQAVVVPDQNAAVEYDHNQRVQSQLQDLRNAILRAAATGTDRPVSVTLGTRYPTACSPSTRPPATGTLATERVGSESRIVLSNVVAVDDQTADYLDTRRRSRSRRGRSPTNRPTATTTPRRPSTRLQSSTTPSRPVRT